MIEIIKERKLITNITYALSYVWKNDKEAGFNFPCDKEGNYIQGTPASQENYKKCVSGEYDVEFEGVKRYDNSYWQERVGRCVCGEEIELSRFTNTCDKCDRDYNSTGQLLADRAQWGEETGETYGDIVRPYDYWDY